MTTALHERALVIDAHNDSIIAHIRRGNLRLDGIQPDNWKERAGAAAYLRQYETPLGNQGVQLDLAKMKQGGLDAAFFADESFMGRECLGSSVALFSKCKAKILI